MDNFSNQAAIYAKYRPNYPNEMFKDLYTHIDSFENVWDCATGNGQLALKLSGKFNKVYATDISKSQLSMSTAKANISYLLTAAEKTNFHDNTFDLITVGHAIHWFDFDRFYEEVKRTGKLNSLLAVIGYGRIYTNDSANKIISQFYDDMFGLNFTENRKYIEEAYKTIPFPFEEINYTTYTVNYKWDIEHLQGYFNSWSAVQKFKETQKKDPTIDVINSLSRLWKKGKQVEFPIFMRLGRIV